MVKFANDSMLEDAYIADKQSKNYIEVDKVGRVVSPAVEEIQSRESNESRSDEVSSCGRNGHSEDEETKKRIERRRYLDRLAWKRKQRRAKEKLDGLTSKQTQLSRKNLTLIKENRGLKRMVLQMNDPKERKQLLQTILFMMQEHQQQANVQKEKLQRQPPLLPGAMLPFGKIPAATPVAAATNVGGSIPFPLQRFDTVGSGDIVSQQLLNIIRKNERQQQHMLNLLRPSLPLSASSLAAASGLDATNAPVSGGSTYLNGVGALARGVGCRPSLSSLAERCRVSLPMQQLNTLKFANSGIPSVDTELRQRQQQELIQQLHQLKHTAPSATKDGNSNLVDLYVNGTNTSGALSPHLHNQTDLILKHHLLKQQQHASQATK